MFIDFTVFFSFILINMTFLVYLKSVWVLIIKTSQKANKQNVYLLLILLLFYISVLVLWCSYQVYRMQNGLNEIFTFHCSDIDNYGVTSYHTKMISFYMNVCKHLNHFLCRLVCNLLKRCTIKFGYKFQESWSSENIIFYNY